MKKKIINGIMMVALVAATSTSFVSCKDTNEDVRVEMQQEYATLLGKLNAMEEKYGDLDGRVGDLETKVANHAADIATLQSEVDLLESWIVDAFSKLVYGVEISGTYNNMLGSINIPGFEPKMLINNWGVASEAGSFPDSELNKGIKIEWAAGDELGTNANNVGFAGYVYANVNRYIDSTPMLSKAQGGELFEITIANSAGEDVEGLLVGNVDENGGPTKDVLSWGWTRADNNIFKFGVGYQGENAKNFKPAKIDLARFKADLKKVWADRNRATGTSKEALGRLFADLYYNLATKDYNAKKYMLKFKWAESSAQTESKDDDAYTADPTDANGDVIKVDETKKEATGLEHIATSEAELVFATIKPLSFESGEALAEKVNSITNSTNRLIEKMEPVVDKIMGRIMKQLKLDNLYLDETAFDKIKMNDDGKYVIELPANTNIGYTYVYYSGSWIKQAVRTGYDPAQINIDDLVTPMVGSFGKINDFIDNVKSMIGSINGKNVGDYLEKFTNKANKLFANHSDQLLRPVLLAINSNGDVTKVSGIKAMPYVASGEITLKPTTFTAELIAPCYAKFVGCKDITAANFNETLFTGDRELKFTPEAGKTYEIVYEAVDFFGNKFKQTYYIQGK